MVPSRSPCRQIIRTCIARPFRNHRVTPPSRHGPRYSTSAGDAGPQPSQHSGLSMFASVTAELDKIAPRFEVTGEQIRMLRGPAELYEVLKVSKGKANLYASA